MNLFDQVPERSPESTSEKSTQTAQPLAARLIADLSQGMSVPVASTRQGISVALGEIITDDLLCRGVLQSAGSLCASGLGMCGGATSNEAKVHCAGCPLL